MIVFDIDNDSTSNRKYEKNDQLSQYLTSQDEITEKNTLYFLSYESNGNRVFRLLINNLTDMDFYNITARREFVSFWNEFLKERFAFESSLEKVAEVTILLWNFFSIMFTY